MASASYVHWISSAARFEANMSSQTLKSQYDGTWLTGAGSKNSTIRSRCPRGKPLVALRDAANYIMKLPKTEQAKRHYPQWPGEGPCSEAPNALPDRALCGLCGLQSALRAEPRRICAIILLAFAVEPKVSKPLGYLFPAIF